jgi:hypothetical protein
MIETLKDHLNNLSTVQKILIVCILFVIAYLIYYIIDESKGCEDFKNTESTTKQENSAQKSKTFTLYSTTGCVFCQRYKNPGGLWHDVIKKLNRNKATKTVKDNETIYTFNDIIVREVNCDRGCSADIYSKSYKGAKDVQGFPTVTYKDTDKEFEGDRNFIAEELLKLI